MNDVIITLISETYTEDENGVEKPNYSGKEVFAKVESISAKEFFNAGTNGIKPALKFSEVKVDEYNGEEIIEYNGQRYSVYRTYQNREDVLELYVERKAGTNVDSTTRQINGYC